MRKHIAIVLDRSSSMGDIREATVVGFNEQVQQIKENSKDSEVYVSLISFNGNVYEHLWNVPAAELCESTVDGYEPYGSTSMRDAVGYVIDKFHETTDVADANNTYLLIIISDGKENSSSHHRAPALKEKIQSCQNSGRWTFTYVGCDERYLAEVASAMAIPVANVALWDPTSPIGARKAFRNSSAHLGAYMRTSGLSNTNFYSSSGVERVDLSADTVHTADLESDTIKCANARNIFGTSTRVNFK